MVMIIIVCIVVGFIMGVVTGVDIFGKRTVYYKQLAEKHLDIMKVFKHWLIIYEKGRSIETYFVQHGYKKIAIYGMGFLGDRLLAELINTDIKIEYLIDRNASYMYGEIPVYSPYDDLKSVDVIVITPVYYFYSISNQLNEKTDSKLVSIEDVLRI